MTVQAGWYEGTRRWMQLNLVEDDPLTTDVGWWQDLWRRCRVQGITVAAAGAVAYYPTDVPLHARSAFLGERDLFGEMVDAARDLGIRVLARFELSFLGPEVLGARPEWFRRGSDGRALTVAEVAAGQLSGGHDRSTSIRRLAFAGDHCMPCWEGAYYTDQVPRIMTELATRYDVDGFFANGWPHPIELAFPPTIGVACHCSACLARWHDHGGGAPYPVVDDPTDPVWQSFVDFVLTGSERRHAALQAHARSLRSDLTFVACTAGSASSGVRWSRFGPLDLLANDCQARTSLGVNGQGTVTNGAWLAGRSAKIMKSVAQGRPVHQIVGAWQAGGPSRPPLRRSAQAPGEITVLLAQAAASGLRPWVNAAGGTVYDSRWVEPVQEYLSWHAGVEELLCDGTDAARIAVLWTPEGCAPLREGSGPSYADALNGWYLALLRARLPFRLVAAELLTADDLVDDELDVLVVPSGAVLGPEAAELVRSRIDRGGVIVGCGVTVTDGSSLGRAFAESELDGPHAVGYLEIDDPDHPLVAGLARARYVPSGHWQARGSVRAGTAVGRSVPPLPFLADKAFVPADSTGPARLVLDERVVHFGADLDAVYGETQHLDAATVMTNSVRAVADGRPAVVEVQGPGLLDVAVWRHGSSVAVHLVNLTSPDIAGGPVKEVVALGPLTVRLALGPGVGTPGVRRLATGERLTPRPLAGGVCEVVLDRLDAFEVVAFEPA